MADEKSKHQEKIRRIWNLETRKEELENEIQSWELMNDIERAESFDNSTESLNGKKYGLSVNPFKFGR